MAFSDKAVPEWISEVKEKYGKADTKYACVGYCEYTLRFCLKSMN